MKLICFFALLAIIAPRIAIVNGIGSGAGLLSDDSQTPFLLECRIPDNSSLDSINVNLTQEERARVDIEGRCFMACAASDRYRSGVRRPTNYSVFFAPAG